MLDFMWRNMIGTLIEGFRVIRWLATKVAPPIVYWITFLVIVIYGTSRMSIAVILTGWKMVVKDTTDSRIKDELEEKTLTLDKEPRRRKWIAVEQNFWILMGFVINIGLVVLAWYGVNLFLSR